MVDDWDQIRTLLKQIQPKIDPVSQPSSQAFSGRMLGEHWDVAQDVRSATQARRRFLRDIRPLVEAENLPRSA
jgi:hypothetical protein